MDAVFSRFQGLCQQLRGRGLDRGDNNDYRGRRGTSVQSEYPRIVLTAEQIRKRVQEMAGRISADFQGKTLHVVGVMENGFVFMADVVRELDLDVVGQFVRAESKEANSS